MSVAPVPVVPRSKPERAFMALTMIAAGQFLWVFAMGLLAGGQFHAEEWPRWDALAPWPVMPIPAWLTIAIGVAAVVAALLMTRRPRQYAELPVLVQQLVLTVLLLVGMPVFLAAMYAQGDGLQPHWIAALPQVVTIVALVVRITITARRRPDGARA